MKNLIHVCPLIVSFCFLITSYAFTQELTDDGLVHQINFSGVVEDYIIPSDITYDRIEFFLDGGDGGKGSACNIKGGKGAQVTAAFNISDFGITLRPGGTIRFIVGERGRNRTGNTESGGGGGGGGTAILYKHPGATSPGNIPFTNLINAGSDWVILAVAGGGGGSYTRRNSLGDCGSNSKKGQGARTGTSGGGSGINTGGSNGSGGKNNGNSGAGGGYLFAGQDQNGQSGLDNGRRGRLGGGAGGYFINSNNQIITSGKGGWGYGGGGAGKSDNSGGGGGGGGFSGGGGGIEGDRRGFGGGSFVNDEDIDDFRSIQGDQNVSNPNNGYITYRFFNSNGLIARCKNVTVQLDASSTQTFYPIEADDGSYTTDESTILNFYAFPAGTAGIAGFFNFDCTDLGDHDFVLMVIANQGLPAYCSFNLTIEDHAPPIAQCKDVTAQLNISNSVILSPGSVDNGSMDACSPHILTLDNNSFTCSNIGDNTVELTVRDEDDNIATCTANVTVSDIGAPQATCNFFPITIQLDASGSQSISVSQVLIGDTDNCDIFSRNLSKSSFDCSDIGTNSVTATVTDPSGNTGTCTASINVESAGPVAVCQDATVSLNDSGNANLQAADVDGGSGDSCNPVSLNVSPSSFDCSQLGNQEVTLTVTTQDNNQSTCTASVTVEDNIPPVALCKDETIQLNASGAAIRHWSDFDDDSYDNCGSVSIVNNESFLPFDCSNLGVNTLNLIVSDGYSTSSCLATVTIVDNIAPLAFCKAATIQLDNSSTATLTPNKVRDFIVEGCIIQSVTVNQSDFDCSNIGANEVTLNATDQSGNTGTCTATVTVEDNIPPVALCKDLTIDVGLFGIQLRNRSAFNDGSYDNCGSVTVLNNFFPITFDCSSVGINTINLTVSDGNLTSSCTATATVVDNALPIATCQPATVQLDVDGIAHPTPEEVLFGSSDACGIQSRTVNPSSFDCDDIGSQEVTVTVTDNNGNSNTCSTIVTIVDEMPPVALCKDLTINVGGGLQQRYRSDFDDGSYDNCGSVSFLNNIQPLTFRCIHLGENLITLTVTDGNLTSSCTATATVIDNVKPTAVCKDFTLQLGENGTGHLTPGNVLLLSTDACAIQSRTVSQSDFDCNDIGTQEVQVTVTDNSGNARTCTASVTVESHSLSAICQPTTIGLDENGMASVSAADVDGGSSSACSDAITLSLDQMDFDCNDLGANTVILTVTDNESITSTCSATVTVEDVIDPNIVCPDDVVINNDPGQCGATHTVILPYAEDNCQVAQLRYRYRRTTSMGINPPGTSWSSWRTTPTVYLPSIGYWKIQWEATDANTANAARCRYLIRIRDNEPPVPVCVDLTINLNGAAETEILGDQLWDEGASSDNCVIDPEFFDVPAVTISCDQTGSVIPVTVIIPDLFGNKANCTSNITVEGLPCGWQSDQINCTESAQMGYDPATGTYNLSAENCYDPNYYSNSDAQSMLQQELCGDGEIIAHVADIDGDAWAGIFMRENNDPGAKMLQLAINNSGLAQRQLRQSSGSLAFKHLFQNQGKFWLKLTRSGNQFGAFLSSDGIAWDLVLMTNIPMTNCIQVGLFVSNTTSGSMATAWFDNVQIIPPFGGNALQEFNEQLAISNAQLSIINHHSSNNNDQHLMTNTQFANHTDFQVYPNPTSGALNLELHAFLGQPIEIQLFNQNGQMQFSKAYDENHEPMEKIWLEHLPGGIYLLRVKAGTTYFTKKVSLLR